MFAGYPWPGNVGELQKVIECGHPFPGPFPLQRPTLLARGLGSEPLRAGTATRCRRLRVRLRGLGLHHPVRQSRVGCSSSARACDWAGHLRWLRPTRADCRAGVMAVLLKEPASFCARVVSFRSDLESIILHGSGRYPLFLPY